MTSCDSALRGTVVSVQANYYWVRVALDDGSLSVPQATLLCTRRALLKKIGTQVMVGDRVRVEDPDWDGSRGVIVSVDPRQTQLDRPPVANADQVLLVFALAQPDLDMHQLTRFLVKSELTGLKVCLCLNKQDLLSPEDLAAWRNRLSAWGYDPVMISVLCEEGIASLLAILQQQTTIVSGPSGVGKSSLINKLIPSADLRVSKVSGKLGRGRHTTRHVELFELPNGGLLADTPGFNQPDINCAPNVLGRCFPEIRDRLREGQCQFADCLHQEEPGCVVRGDWERYDNYLELLEECRVRAQTMHDSPNSEAAFKIKVAEDGKIQQEPRLQAKRYRRVSRRSRKQALQDLRYEVMDRTEDLESQNDEGWDADF